VEYRIARWSLSSGGARSVGPVAGDDDWMSGKFFWSCSDELIDPRSLSGRQRGLSRRLGRAGIVGIAIGLHGGRLGRTGVGRGHGRRRWNARNAHGKDPLTLVAQL